MKVFLSSFKMWDQLVFVIVSQGPLGIGQDGGVISHSISGSYEFSFGTWYGLDSCCFR